MPEYANARVLIYDNRQEMIDAFCRHLVELGQDAIRRHGRFALALTGGRTPGPFYERLAEKPYRDQLEWSNVRIFFGDERCVPPDDDASNYKLARERLLSRVPLSEKSIFRMPADDPDHARAARAYEAALERELNLNTLGIPAFDLVLLGVGEDGHIASIFPGTEATRARDRHVMFNHVEKLGAWRMTLTYPVLNAARHVWILATDAGKREIAARALGHLPGGNVLPIWHVRPADGRLVWWLSSEAAALIPPEEQDRPEGEDEV
ncbi:MAG TPA: 6-phosphogluconolactonase [Candidatus Sumerlaeota bacterium]|nr:MAG: 6-phosphogluconolactonase [candidate division BRC1 bacterium ADurb.BinA292]HOE95889.1 6-phosphogluconolactonase [Candidatus Sumerlaeota bacterium]HOR28119.1 6-phosphogluconolactonase [Candidatus Sumerlaeota bacterium]HPK02191.1 6-phosphogluconolactonase [Candidatus Sumerlaeota bacterium]